MRYLTTIGEKTYTIDINRANEVVLDAEPQALDCARSMTPGCIHC